MSNMLITIPEPTPEYWARVLRGWCKEYEAATMLTWLPLELRIALYRYVFSCTTRFYVDWCEDRFRDSQGSRMIMLKVRDTTMRLDIAFSAREVKVHEDALLEFIDDLVRGIQPKPSRICGEIFGALIRPVARNRYQIIRVGIEEEETLFESPLCIELVQALMTLVEMAKE